MRIQKIENITTQYEPVYDITVAGDIPTFQLENGVFVHNSLQVPKQYFAQTDDSTGFNGGTSLTVISSRYAKTVKHIQNILTQLIKDLFNLILLDKGLDSYINNFEIHIQPPVTQEDVDKMENQSTKVQLSRDIMDMLEDVEEPVARLKILKSLMKNIVTDDEVISEIDAQIEALEKSEAEEVTDEPLEDAELDVTDEDITFENGQIPSEGDFSEFVTDEKQDESSETILPSPEELGVNLADEEG